MLGELLFVPDHILLGRVSTGKPFILIVIPQN